MKILWLNANLLLPLDKGGKLRTWHVMRHLAVRHEITYLSFCDPDQPKEDHLGMSEVCAHLHTIPRRVRSSSTTSTVVPGGADTSSVPSAHGGGMEGEHSPLAKRHS